jgi:hypothetical protein
MTVRPRPFRYHAVDLDRDLVLGTYPSQAEATVAILKEGESGSLREGATRQFAVRVESIASGETYDIPLEVAGKAGESDAST